MKKAKKKSMGLGDSLKKGDTHPAKYPAAANAQESSPARSPYIPERINPIRKPAAAPARSFQRSAAKKTKSVNIGGVNASLNPGAVINTSMNRAKNNMMIILIAFKSALPDLFASQQDE